MTIRDVFIPNEDRPDIVANLAQPGRGTLNTKGCSKDGSDGKEGKEIAKDVADGVVGGGNKLRKEIHSLAGAIQQGERATY